MTILKKLTVTTLFILFICNTAFSQVEDDFTKDIKKYFDVSGTKQTFQSVIPQLFAQFKSMSPGTAEETWKSLEEELKTTSIIEIYNMMVPVYKKNFTQADVKEMIKFYETPVGKKLSSKMPEIAQESMQIGQQWGMALGQKVMERLKEKNPTK